MEELLNKLIEKGWKPFEDDKIHSFEIIYVTWKILNIVAKRWRWQVNKHYSIRDICSKSSWLWQFVCENGMIKEDEDKKEERYMYECEYNTWSHSTTNYLKQNIYTKEYFYKYFIIESALCDEDKLEEFLLKNIKVE